MKYQIMLKLAIKCRHNIGYWRNESYFGFGAGAVSCLRGSRKRNVADPLRYCELIEAGKSVIIEEETLEGADSLRETVIMGLRMNKGVSVSGLTGRYGINPVDYYGTTLQN